jgi:hypothetical protein
VTGSLASSFYGEYRSTNDIDLVADLQLKHVESIVRSFPAQDFYLDADAIRDAIVHRFQFNIIHIQTAVKVNVIIADETDFNRSRFSRSRSELLPDGSHVRLASAEDVILKEIDYYRDGGSDKHLRDIAGILRVAGVAIDRTYIDQWAQILDVSEEWQILQSREIEGR